MVMSFFPSRGLSKWGPFLVLVALVGMVGCGGGKGTVSGQVKLDGKPLKGGRVTFVSSPTQPGGIGSTEINADGSYTVSSLPAGKYKISVDTAYMNPAGKGNLPTKYNAPGGQKSPYAPSSGPSPEELAKRFVMIPDHYADPDRSKLEYEVKSGNQTKDIELKNPLQ